MTLKLRFKPVSHSWVALHPNPQGVIQFIGGAFFGTFGPMLFYRHLLQYFFDKAYTLVLFPFDFTFNHYREAGFLVREQRQLLPELVDMAVRQDYDPEIYRSDRNYIWMGHSLGCKYISLLEGFSALPENQKERHAFIRDLLTGICDERYSEADIQQVIAAIDALIEDLERETDSARKLVRLCATKRAGERSAGLESPFELDFDSPFIKNQRSILLAPDISGTASAIRPKALADLIDRLGLGVKPTPAVTHALIRKSNLFNLLGLACFQSDKIAEKTCQWFIDDLGKPPEKFQRKLAGGHLRPLGIRLGNLVVNPFFDRPLLSSIADRNAALESPINELLETLHP